MTSKTTAHADINRSLRELFRAAIESGVTAAEIEALILGKRTVTGCSECATPLVRATATVLRCPSCGVTSAG